MAMSAHPTTLGLRIVAAPSPTPEKRLLRQQLVALPNTRASPGPLRLDGSGMARKVNCDAAANLHNFNSPPKQGKLQQLQQNCELRMEKLITGDADMPCAGSTAASRHRILTVALAARRDWICTERKAPGHLEQQELPGQHLGGCFKEGA